MPADILTTDTLFPELNGGESTDQKFEMVTDYLWLLREQLTYALTNLGIANFNQTQLGKLSGIIVEPLKVVLAEQETQFTEFGVELGKISGRITDVEEVIGDEKSGLIQRMAAFELTSQGFSQSFTEIGKVLNGEDGKSGLVKDVADAAGAADEAKQAAETVAGNYISKSAVTQTAKGFELDVVGTNSSGVSQTRMKMTADGLKIYNKAGVAVLDFDTESGDLEVQGTVTGSKIYGSSFYSSLNADSIGASFFLIDSNKISAVRRTSSSSMSPDGISMMMLGSTASIDFYTSGEKYFSIQRDLNAGYMAIASTVSLLIAGDTYGDRVIMQLVNGGVSIQATNGLTVNGTRID